MLSVWNSRSNRVRGERYGIPFMAADSLRVTWAGLADTRIVMQGVDLHDGSRPSPAQQFERSTTALPGSPRACRERSFAERKATLRGRQATLCPQQHPPLIHSLPNFASEMNCRLANDWSANETGSLLRLTAWARERGGARCRRSLTAAEFDKARVWHSRGRTAGTHCCG